MTTLEGLNPKSKYLDEIYGSYLLALNKTGAAAKIPTVAEKALGSFPENEDLLLYMLDTAMSRKQSRPRAWDTPTAWWRRSTSIRSRRVFRRRDWERKRTAALSRGYWTAGVISAEKGVWMTADKDLRAALPLIQGNNAMLGPALYYLGISNYQLGKMTLSKAKVLEAAKFSEQAMVIDGPHDEQARHNALVMRKEAATMR